jgi:hypothetical protein
MTVLTPYIEWPKSFGTDFGSDGVSRHPQRPVRCRCVIGNATGNAVRKNRAFNDCMMALGWHAADRAPAAFPQGEPKPRSP